MSAGGAGTFRPGGEARPSKPTEARSSRMPTSQNKAPVRRYYEEMWDRWDLPLADELIAEDVAFRGSLGVSVRGREGFKEYVRAVRRAFPDFHNRVEELVAEGDRVVARLTY